VQLSLEAHRQAISDDPIRQLTRRDLLVTRREQHRAALIESVLTHALHSPLIVRARAKHELHFVMRGQQRQVVPAVTSDFTGIRRLDIDDAGNPRVDAGDVDGTAGFERNRVAGITQRRQQRQAILLRQWLSASDTDMAYTVAGDFGEQLCQCAPLAAVEGVGGVAVATAERAAGQPHEHRRPADVRGLSLQGQEDFGDFQTPRCRRHLRRREREIVGRHEVQGFSVLARAADEPGPPRWSWNNP